MQEWVLFISALGGFELIRFLVQSFMFRRNTKRKKEIELAKEQIVLEEMKQNRSQTQTGFLEGRLEERDRQIDLLYSQLRKEQGQRFRLQEELHKAILSDTIHRLKRCDVVECSERKPPLEK